MSNGADNWKNRRRMAWYSMSAGLFYPALLLILPEAKADSFAEIAIPFYAFITIIVTAYFKFATDDHCDERKYPTSGGS